MENRTPTWRPTSTKNLNIDFPYKIKLVIATILVKSYKKERGLIMQEAIFDTHGLSVLQKMYWKSLTREKLLIILRWNGQPEDK